MEHSKAKMSKTVLQKNINVPVHMTDLSAFDDSISYMRERFQAEMSRVSEEMNKFSSDLMRFYTSTVPSSSVTSQLPKGTAPPSVTSQQPGVTAQPLVTSKQPGGTAQPSITSQQPGVTAQPLVTSKQPGGTAQPSLTSQQPGGKAQPSESSQANWAAITESPLVLDEGETKKLKLQFDVSQFDPAEVKVQILSDILYIKAKHDERSENTTVLREYSRQFMLPRGIDPEAVVSSLSRDGVLTVEVPLPQLMLELGKDQEKKKTDKQVKKK